MYVYYWHEPVQEVPVKSRLVAHVRRVEVTDQLATGGDYDYADAYEVRLPEPDSDARNLGPGRDGRLPGRGGVDC